MRMTLLFLITTFKFINSIFKKPYIKHKLNKETHSQLQYFYQQQYNKLFLSKGEERYQVHASAIAIHWIRGLWFSHSLLSEKANAICKNPAHFYFFPHIYFLILFFFWLGNFTCFKKQQVINISMVESPVLLLSCSLHSSHSPTDNLLLSLTCWGSSSGCHTSEVSTPPLELHSSSQTKLNMLKSGHLRNIYHLSPEKL
jgi:hypothetical protein